MYTNAPNEDHPGIDPSKDRTPSLGPSQQEYKKIICECGQCSILGYISGTDQCSGSKPPQTVTTHKPANSKEFVSKTEVPYGIFRTALLKETEKLHTKFSNLLHETISLLKKTTKFSEVKRYIETLLAIREIYP